MPTVEKEKKRNIDDYMIPQETSPFQLINCDLIELPPPTVLHQVICTKLIQIIANFLTGISDNGVLIHSVDVKFDDENIFRPDVIYVTGERKAAIIKDRIDGAPDFIIEVISLQSAYYDMRQKQGIYEKYGVKEYLIIDTIAFAGELYILENNGYTLLEKATKTEQLHLKILPGLVLDMSQIF